MSRPYPRGAVVVAPDLVGPRTKRPYVLVTTTAHPFYGEEYTAVPVSTTPREAAVELSGECFSEGDLPRRSFAGPWNVVTLKHAAISMHAGTLTEATVEALVDEIVRYLRDK